MTKNPPPTNPWQRTHKTVGGHPTLIREDGFFGSEGGVKKAAWERGGFQAAAYLD